MPRGDRAACEAYFAARNASIRLLNEQKSKRDAHTLTAEEGKAMQQAGDTVASAALQGTSIPQDADLRNALVALKTLQDSWRAAGQRQDMKAVGSLQDPIKSAADDVVKQCRSVGVSVDLEKSQR